ncbi:hypothetical protein BST26_20730 [Mycolicibacterium insubricum]|uniref:Helix-turn-helix domain-containing protein n=1 Tax=Mycolicibacterium insubricum TaxID=444597 RepID=A0A1X0CRW1_9MYCO|nr:hypothetical protein BST26_20730 [Mycolicibacterium insubricum]
MSEKDRARRARYTQRRAERTASAAAHRRPWSIEDARTALDLSLSVPEAAATVGRTAAAVESLRSRWRRGALPEALTIHLPTPHRGGDHG